MINKNWKTLPNQDIREYADQKKVRMWEIAAILGVSDMWITRKLRYELSDEEATVFYSAIDEIASQK